MNLNRYPIHNVSQFSGQNSLLGNTLGLSLAARLYITSSHSLTVLCEG